MPAGHGHHKVNTVTRNELNLTQNICLPVQWHFRKHCLYFSILNFSMVCLFENNIRNSITFTAILRRAPTSCFFLKKKKINKGGENKTGTVKKKTKLLLVQETDSLAGSPSPVIFWTDVLILSILYIHTYLPISFVLKDHFSRQ